MEGTTDKSSILPISAWLRMYTHTHTHSLTHSLTHSTLFDFPAATVELTEQALETLSNFEDISMMFGTHACAETVSVRAETTVSEFRTHFGGLEGALFELFVLYCSMAQLYV